MSQVKHIKGHLLCAVFDPTKMIEHANLDKIASFVYKLDTTGYGGTFEYKWHVLAAPAPDSCFVAILTTNAVVDDGYTYDQLTATIEKFRIAPDTYFFVTTRHGIIGSGAKARLVTRREYRVSGSTYLFIQYLPLNDTNFKINQVLPTEKPDSERLAIKHFQEDVAQVVNVEPVALADVDDLDNYLEYEGAYQSMNSVLGILKRGLAVDLAEPRASAKPELLKELGVLVDECCELWKE